MRFKKEFDDGSRITYVLDGTKILEETKTDSSGSGLYKFEYFYDLYGIIGLRYNNKNYVFIKDALGNILYITYRGKTIGGYHYDAFGNPLEGGYVNPNNTPDDTFVLINNPFRYRGYYYDLESHLYYLQSRYYDPEIYRFISPDSIDYLDPSVVGGLNLYIYCLNNPVMYIDPSGTIAISTLITLFLVIGGMIAGGIIANNIASNRGETGWALAGWTFIGIVGGGIIGGTIGHFAAPYLAGFMSQSFTFGSQMMMTIGGQMVMTTGLTVTGAQIVYGVGALTLSGVMMVYKPKKVAPRIKSNTKKK